MALLAEHLGGDDRRLDADQLYERLDSDLEQLRGAGMDLKGTARSYVAQWRTAGYLLRRPSEDSRGETFELSSQALAVLRFIEELQSPRQSATQSRLASITAQLRQLAIDTDPQSQRRLERLEYERARIDAHITAIRNGEDQPLDGERAAERIRDVLDQAAAVPDDFARVRAEFEQLNAILREKIIDSGDSQSRVLDDIFRGVDLIADSEAGRTFRAFTALVLDPAVSGAFDDDVDQILERDFARTLAPSRRKMLREFIATLKERASEIQDVTTIFARGLRRYVQSQDYQRDRVLRRLIQEALRSALPASAVVRPFDRIGVELTLTGVRLAGAAMVRLHDPADYDATAEVTINETGVADLAELRELARLTEIDVDELRDNVNAVLAHQSEASVAQVLDLFPATQGVASVVGLMWLAAIHGVVDEDREHLAWDGTDGVRRESDVLRHRFVGLVA
jgi:hypothetical protein